MELRAEKEVSKKDFINSVAANNIVKVSQLHIMYVTFVIFREKIEEKSYLKCPNNVKNLTNLCILLGLGLINDNISTCYQSGYLQNAGVDFSSLIFEAIKIVNLRIRPVALSIVESLPISDEALCSAIGNSYGDIYETHLEWARASRCN